MYLRNRKFSIEEHPFSVTGQRVEIVVLYADMRKFSIWSLSTDPGVVAELIDAQYHSVIDITNDNHVSFFKFLGDGFLLLWEIADEVDYLDAISFSLNSPFS